MIPEVKAKTIITNLNRIIDMKKDLNGYDTLWAKFKLQSHEDGCGNSKVDSAIETIISFLSIEYVKVSEEFKEKFKEEPEFESDSICDLLK